MLVLVFGFLLASFPVRGSEIWAHLAAGRELLAGSGAAESNWLYGVAVHGAYQFVGATGLLLLKAALAAMLAWALLVSCGKGQPRWLAPLGCALCLLTLLPFLDLDPLLLTILFLAVTLAWLHAYCEPDRRPRAAAIIGLLALFVLWANMAPWCWLGPLSCALWLWGAWVESRRSRSTPAPRRQLAIISALGAAACLVNPHGFGALAPPPMAAELFATFGRPSFTPAGLALYVLTGLGLISFAVNSQRSVADASTFAVFMLLSVFWTEGVAFFAVAAGPITVRNLQTSPSAHEAQPRRLVGALSTLLLLTGIATAWPGWLDGSPPEPRRWTLAPDASLAKAGQQLAAWRDAGRLPENTLGVYLAGDIAHHFAWFAPGLRGVTATRPADLTDEARARMTHLVLSAPDDPRQVSALASGLGSPHWDLVYLDGSAVIFARREPGQVHNRLGTKPLSLERRGLRPAVEADLAPPDGPPRDPQPRRWYEAFYKPHAAADPRGAEALVYLKHFEAHGPVYAARSRSVWETSLAVGYAGLQAESTGLPLVAAVQLELLRLSRERAPAHPFDVTAGEMIGRFLGRRDHGPPTSLLLAVRAVRRALHDHPDDARAHLRLGQAYRLMDQTVERGASAHMLMLQQLRRVQLITALKRAVLLRPELFAAHDMLARAYQESGYLDLSHRHVVIQVRLAEQMGPSPGESPTAFAERLARLQEHEEQLGRRVRELLNLVETQGFNLSVLGRARLAADRGLAGRALELLLQSGYASFGREGALLELQLLLLTGQVEEVRSWMAPEQEEVLGTFEYRWLQAQLSAAIGAYADAERNLRVLTGPGIEKTTLRGMALTRVGAIGYLLAKAMLDGVPGQGLPLREDYAELRPRFESMVSAMRRQSDLFALRGLLALEAGRCAQAEELFRLALQARGGDDGAALLARNWLKSFAANQE